MGFWPYFRQAQESEGGALSPFSLDPSTSLIGTDITLFCIARLFLGEEVELIFIMSLQVEEEGGDSELFSGVVSFSSCSPVNGLLLLLNLPSIPETPLLYTYLQR